MGEKIKKLREDAWALQNRLSGRPGISSVGPGLPDDVKTQIYAMCTSAINMCTDFEQGYMDPADFDERAERFERKMREIRDLMQKTEQAAAVPSTETPKPRTVQQGKVDSAAAVCIKENLVRSDQFQEALARVAACETILDLSGLGLSDADVVEISGLLQGKQLGSIDFSHNCICDYGCQLLAGFLAVGNLAGLSEIRLSGNSFGDAGRAALVDGLQVIRKDLIIKI